MNNKLGLIGLLAATAFLIQACRESTLYPNRNPDSGTNGSGTAISDVYGVEWELEAFEVWRDGAMVSELEVPSGQRYSLTFRQDGVEGQNDCNAYGGEYQLSANNGIVVSNVISTLMGCTAGSRNVEYAKVLESAERYDVNSTTLHLFAAENPIIDLSSSASPTALRFKRVNGPAIQLVQMELFDPAPSDPFVILNAQVQGDELQLKVQYSGGCNEHTFALIGPLTIPTGTPTPILSYLHHSANGDACEALINRDLVFDLTPLKGRWQIVTGKTSGTIALTVNDLHSGSIGPMTYLIGNGGSGIPNWLQDTINAIKSRPVTSPAESIVQYTYKGAVVYYRPPICCDIFSDLYDANGNVICHPDGGFAGNGDGMCTDFLGSRTDKKLIWQDPR